jgi:hypothetical protein
MGRVTDIIGVLGSTLAIGRRAKIDASALTAARNFVLPDKSGTLALDSPDAVQVWATTSKVLALSDLQNYLRSTNAAASTLTVPANAEVGFAIGSKLSVRRAGAAALVITPDTGVIVNAPAGGTLSLETGMTVTLKKVDTDEWDLSGQTVPGPGPGPDGIVIVSEFDGYEVSGFGWELDEGGRAGSIEPLGASAIPGAPAGVGVSGEILSVVYEINGTLFVDVRGVHAQAPFEGLIIDGSPPITGWVNSGTGAAATSFAVSSVTPNPIAAGVHSLVFV